MTDIRIIDGALVRRLLDMDSCIEAMRQAFRANRCVRRCPVRATDFSA